MKTGREKTKPKLKLIETVDIHEILEGFLKEMANLGYSDWYIGKALAWIVDVFNAWKKEEE